MPIPKPEKDEQLTEFINRCMEDEVMVKEFSNKNQRLAVCAKEWSKSL